MIELRITGLLVAVSCAFGQCTMFTVNGDSSLISIDCYREGPLSAREIMRNYLKLNPAPVLMVVRAFGNRETWSSYKEKIGVSDIDQVRYWLESLSFAPKRPAISEAVLFGGRITVRERYGEVVSTSSEVAKTPPGSCALSIPKWVRLAHVHAGERRGLRRRATPAGVDLFLVASPGELQDLSRLEALTETISRCLPSASVELDARSDPFFFSTRYPILNPFFKTTIDEAAIRAAKTVSCNLDFDGKAKCWRLDPRGL